MVTRRSLGAACVSAASRNRYDASSRPSAKRPVPRRRAARPPGSATVGAPAARRPGPDRPRPPASPPRRRPPTPTSSTADGPAPRAAAAPGPSRPCRVLASARNAVDSAYSVSVTGTRAGSRTADPAAAGTPKRDGRGRASRSERGGSRSWQLTGPTCGTQHPVPRRSGRINQDWRVQLDGSADRGLERLTEGSWPRPASSRRPAGRHPPAARALRCPRPSLVTSSGPSPGPRLHRRHLVSPRTGFRLVVPARAWRRWHAAARW